MSEQTTQTQDTSQKVNFSFWGKVMKYVFRFWKILLGMLLSIITQAGTDAAFPLFTQYAIDHYDPTVIGYEWDEDNPRIQLEPRGERGYIELRAIRKQQV